MGLTDYSSRSTKTTSNGTRITTSKSTDGSYTTKTYHSASGDLVRGAVYRGNLNDDHSHYENGRGYARGVLRSDVFKS